MPGTFTAARLLTRQDGLLNHLLTIFATTIPAAATMNGAGAMKGITIGIVATLLGTMAYVLVAVALASVG